MSSGDRSALRYAVTAQGHKRETLGPNGRTTVLWFCVLFESTNPPFSSPSTVLSWAALEAWDVWVKIRVPSS